MKAAVVGCGNIAKMHALALSAMEDVHIVGFADIRPERAEDFARQYGGNAYASLEAMLDAETPDVLHICTPHHLHVPMTAAAAARGIAVFAEKPPLIRPEEHRTLLDAEAKVPVGICFQNRYNPENLFLRDQVLSPEAGALLGARAFVTWSRGEAYYAHSGGWRGKALEAGGGVMMNQAVHTLDLLVWLLGRPASCKKSFTCHQDHIDVEDTAEVWLRYTGGQRALLYATTAYVTNAPVLLEVQCENCTIRAEGKTVQTIWSGGRCETVSFPEQTAAGKGYWGASHAACIADFYGCLRDGRPFALSPSKLADTIGVLMEVYHGH